MRLPALFLLCALPLGLLLTRLVPMGEAPDETAHIVRAYALSIGELIGHREPATEGRAFITSGYDVDAGLLAVSFPSPAPDGGVTAALEAQRSTTGWANRTIFAETPNTAVYAPLFYVPAATALAIAKAAGAGPYLSVQVARAANLLCFGALGFAALRLARRMRMVLFVLLCLPSSLSLAASVNQDGLLTGTVCLAAALLTRPGWPARWAAAAAMAAACLAKPPYLPLLAALLVPASGWRWRDLPRGVALGALAAAPAVLWSLAATHWAAVPFRSGVAYAPGPLYAGPATAFSSTDFAAQVGVLTADPLRLITLPATAFGIWWLAWMEGVVGVLGRLNLMLPRWLYVWWYVALGCALAGDVLTPRLRAAGPGVGGAACLVAGAALATLAVCLVQYVIWTPVGYELVEGVQGRYFLPILAILALAVPAPVSRSPRGIQALFAAPALLICAAQFLAIPVLVLRRWYLH